MYTPASSFKHLDKLTFTVCHTHHYNQSTPSCYLSVNTFKGYYSELTSYTALTYFYWVVSKTRINAKAMPITDTWYSCHITTV